MRRRTGPEDCVGPVVRQAIRCAVFAPSPYNTQPWLFHVSGDTIELSVDPGRRLPVADPVDREAVVSCGAALFTLRVAFAHLGYATVVEITPDPCAPFLLARVRAVAGLPESGIADPYPMIATRRTNRDRYARQRISAELVSELAADVEAERAQLVPLSPTARLAVARLVGAAERGQQAHAAFRAELAAWLRGPRARRPDGITTAALGMSQLRAARAPAAVRIFGTGRARESTALVLDAPLVAVLTTARDDRAAALAAGQALQRVLLRATAHGLVASFFSAPLQIAPLRVRVAEAAGYPGHPQTLMRLGYGVTPPGPRRRPLSDVIV